MDIEFMRTLGRSTNILPVIGRADSVSEVENRLFKKKVFFLFCLLRDQEHDWFAIFAWQLMEQISKHDLKIYTFPIFSDDDENYITRNNALEDMLPFALVGSVETHEVNGKQVRGRKYPWGIVQGNRTEKAAFCISRSPVPTPSPHIVDNREHCDFSVVKEILLK